jgi:peptidoglycan/xylan/chitin deacetylase (PgdA/CDA1 family)
MVQMKDRLKRLARAVGLRRARIAAARMYVERHGLASFGRGRRRNRGRILCYHSVGQAWMGVNDVTPAQFRRHIEIALAAGYRFVPASHIARTGGTASELAITFDDALTSVRTQAAPILRSNGIPWSVFVISGWAEQKDDFAKEQVLGWGELGALAADGATLGSHSVTHPDFAGLDPDRMREELEASRDMFEKRLGFRPTEFAIPFGQSNNWPAAARAAATQAGYELVYAQAEDTRPPDTVPRTFVTKFDHVRTFTALLDGKFDRWEEWY